MHTVKRGQAKGRARRMQAQEKDEERRMQAEEREKKENAN